ncbi:tRNA pseudouridine(13) synthase TruD [Marinobacter nanhaiticus D15-8W]|uniref:tRNA pseudouridine synthase D n=1 Tax=Marinobacter nanhaiticus D15-8W TaxID=626887 RepID=N6VW70_9GAMM|nr:tRNA pseudouridine(13) synthase TruD [Marinobacter nanhaiticus]ENO14480.1 tRNA pseudouridine(13) synthase TruD [Marinobacter nanhaiticus D15-8W]BES71874.1 tRNA pseudouridine(13) synthase TruD [Marinobacter nanhaiticus D15-8W]
MSQWRLDWPPASGQRLGTCVLRQEADDFQVDELIDIEFTGEGEHLCLRLQKTGDNTEFVAKELARMAGLRPFDVSFCGLKDRHAVTRQWFSLYRPGKPDDTAFINTVNERWPVLDHSRHRRKLRRGEHLGNHFRLRLREVTAGQAEVDQRLSRIALEGVPNYFGPQRFGRDGGNLAKAVADGGRPRRGRNFKAGLAFSAARSWLFNEILAERVEQGNWHRTLEGEPSSEPTGPLWGDGGTSAAGVAADLEWAVVDRFPEVKAVFSSTRMKPERRSLALPLSGLTWTWESSDTLFLDFVLGAGGFATALVAEILDAVSGGPVTNPAS